MSENEKKPADITTMENHAPAPPADSTARLQENHAPTPPAKDEIVTLENHAPAPPALDLDGK